MNNRENEEIKLLKQEKLSKENKTKINTLFEEADGIWYTQGKRQERISCCEK